MADDLGDIEDPLDFDQLSEHLTVGAASANGDRDVGDADDNLDELPPSVMVSNLNVLTPPLTIRIPALTMATHSGQPPTVKVFIPLKTLFKYPTDKDPPSEGMNTFWKGGVQNLEKEMEAYELLNRLSEDSTTGEINPEITMQVCM